MDALCLKANAALITLPAIGFTILIIQFEGYSGVNHKTIVRFTYRFTV